jgi:hypothetical protein
MFTRALPCPNCGCGPSCDLVSDDFSANTIANYTQVSGSWSIGSGKLDPPASGLLKVNQAAPVSPDGARVKWMFNFASNTGTFRVIIDYVDANNYHYCEFICSGSGTATIRLWERVSSVETALASAETVTGFFWSNDYSVALCWTGEVLRATAFFSTSTTPLIFTTADADDLGGDYAGVSVVTAHSSSRIDNLLLSTLADGCDDCPPLCGACSGTVPVEAQVVFTGASNGTCSSCASSFDGTFVLPFRSNIDLGGGLFVCTWFDDRTADCWPMETDGVRTAVYIEKTGGSAWTLAASHERVGGPLVLYEKTDYTSEQACNGFNGVNVPFVSTSTGDCSFSGDAVVTIPAP